MTVLDDLQATLASFASASRLYQLTFGSDDPDFGSGGLLVEAFAAREELQTVGARDIIVLSTNAHLELKKLLGRQASLHVSLADGSRCIFSGLINQAAMLGSEGGLARYRVRLVPWLWLLSQARTSRVWQDKSVIEIVESVFAGYSPHADWRWSDEVGPFMADTRGRSLCIQYRETDLDFISRLLTEEGLGWRQEEHDGSSGGQRLVLFADSSQGCAMPEDASSAHLLGGIGIRFHGAGSQEQQDSIQALGATRTLNPALTTVLSYDYKSKKAIAASVPTHYPVGGKHAPRLESYDHPGLYAWATRAEAERYAQLQQQAHEARNQRWQGRSSVRTLRPGTRFTLTQGPLPQHGDQAPLYAVLAVTSVGLNNLPRPAQEGLAELFGPLPELLEECLQAQTLAPAAAALPTDGMGDVIAQARLLGYANRFEAIRADIPWRPVLTDGSGLRRHPRPTAPGSQSAIVVGADGQDCANGADEIHCDRLGRIRIRFHWQNQHGHASAHANATCWVRVAQRSAGPGMGSQFLPRIGQEVLVQFLEGDINRPLVIGALYNGQGEGGLPVTPGGQPGRAADLSVYEPAHDHAAAAQGNLAGGHSPAWHGAGPGADAAQWGLRSKEFGAAGYNQLLFDDTARQGRIQLKTTQAATELNLGHLIHSADHYRGSFRGLGAELRSDAYGAIRAGAGLLLSTYAMAHDANRRDPAGDNAAGLAHLKQAARIGQNFSQAASVHQSVTFASANGSSQAGASVLDASAAPLPALLNAASGMLSGSSLAQAQADAAGKHTRPGDGQLPHSTDPIIAIAARAGLGMVAAENLQFANGETLTAISGQDSQFIGGQQFRLHSGQAIGLLGGATAPGDGQLGLQLIAAQQPIELQAQNDEIKIQARDDISILSSHAHIDWAAAKSISLSTAGGANITLEGGNITVQCPGKLLVQAGKKSFSGPTQLSYPLPKMPRSVCKRCKRNAANAGSPFSTVEG
jgi:type VI secretion system secreted protein VgrG